MGRDFVSPSAYRKLASGKLRILSLDSFQKKLEKGDYQEHLFDGFAVYTQITQYDYERVLDVVLLIGEGFRRQKESVVNHLAQFAKAHDCQAVEALARLGLESELRPLGFMRTKVQLRKELEGERA